MRITSSKRFGASKPKNDQYSLTWVKTGALNTSAMICKMLRFTEPPPVTRILVEGPKMNEKVLFDPDNTWHFKREENHYHVNLIFGEQKAFHFQHKEL